MRRKKGTRRRRKTAKITSLFSDDAKDAMHSSEGLEQTVIEVITGRKEKGCRKRFPCVPTCLKFLGFKLFAMMISPSLSSPSHKARDVIKYHRKGASTDLTFGKDAS